MTLCTGTRGASADPYNFERCDREVVFRIMVGTPSGAAYAGGYRLCPIHLGRVISFYTRHDGLYPLDWEMRITRILSADEDDRRMSLPRHRRPGLLVATIRSRRAA